MTLYLWGNGPPQYNCQQVVLDMLASSPVKRMPVLGGWELDRDHDAHPDVPTIQDGIRRYVPSDEHIIVNLDYERDAATFSLAEPRGDRKIAAMMDFARILTVLEVERPNARPGFYRVPQDWWREQDRVHSIDESGPLWEYLWRRDGVLQPSLYRQSTAVGVEVRLSNLLDGVAQLAGAWNLGVCPFICQWTITKRRRPYNPYVHTDDTRWLVDYCADRGWDLVWWGWGLWKYAAKRYGYNQWLADHSTDLARFGLTPQSSEPELDKAFATLDCEFAQSVLEVME